MCTLLTIGADQWNRDMEIHVQMDAISNPHGFALLLLDSKGMRTILRSMEIEPILSLLRNMPWERMFLHSRWATQGSIGLDNTHGWHADGVFYMHNGCLSSPDAHKYPVDSQAIGEWIESGGVPQAVQMLRRETFANVFMVDLEVGDYTVYRSTSGSLFTDGLGNYSTNPVGDISKAVGSGPYYWYLEGFAEDAPTATTFAADDVSIDDDGLDDTIKELALGEEDAEYLREWHERLQRDDDMDATDYCGVGDYLPASLRFKRRA